MASKKKILHTFKSTPHNEGTTFFLGKTEPPLSENKAVLKATRILRSNFQTLKGLEAAYEKIRPTEIILTEEGDTKKTDVSRRNSKGRIPEPVNDVLRAQVVFAAAGLDAIVKQLIRDCLGILLKKESSVRTAFAKYIQKTIEDDKGVINAKTLAAAIAFEDQSAYFIQKLTDEMEKTSLQSIKNFFEYINYLGITNQEHAQVLIGTTRDELQKIFDARNQIIHEMDTDHAATKGRIRRVRTRDVLIKYSTILFKISEATIGSVEARLSH